MKPLILGLAALLAAPAMAASSYGRTGGVSYRRGASFSRGGVTRVAGYGAHRASFSQQASGGGAAGTKGNPAPGDVPGWLAHPTPGALIRSAGMGFQTSDGGGVRNNLDFSANGWGGAIAHNETYAQYTTGIGVRQGPPDTPPYPAGQRGGGSGAGGNGITTNGPVLGLDSSGNTTVVNGGIHGGNGNNGGSGGSANNGN